MYLVLTLILFNNIKYMMSCELQTSMCWFLESCIHKWSKPIPQQQPEQACMCRNPTKRNICRFSPHNTSCAGKTNLWFCCLRFSFTHYTTQIFIDTTQSQGLCGSNRTETPARKGKSLCSPYKVKRLHLVEAFRMSPFLIEQESLVGAAVVFRPDIEPALKQQTRGKITM